MHCNSLNQKYDLSEIKNVHFINSLNFYQFKIALEFCYNINNSDIFLHISDIKKLHLLIKNGLCFPEKNEQWKLYVHCQNRRYLEFLIIHGINFEHADIQNTPYYFINNMQFFEYFYHNIPMNNKQKHIIKALEGHLLNDESALFLSKSQKTQALSLITQQESETFIRTAFLKADWRILFYMFSNGFSVFFSTRKAEYLNPFNSAIINARNNINIQQQKKWEIGKLRIYKFTQRLNALTSWGTDIHEVHAKLLQQQKNLLQKSLNSEQYFQHNHSKRL